MKKFFISVAIFAILPACSVSIESDPLLDPSDAKADSQDLMQSDAHEAPDVCKRFFGKTELPCTNDQDTGSMDDANDAGSDDADSNMDVGCPANLVPYNCDYNLCLKETYEQGVDSNVCN